ncbi:MAG: hypothetical protein GQ538_06585 [Xanthomonadales bacterium]|nr:hypothetical protein [Xanthomonadales bacterium]
MKKLLTLASILLLSGCVTYYYPETALEDGVYYAEDDPSYVIDSSGYVDASYYPWSSLDSFYLGYYPTVRYGYGYSSGFSFGISYGYSPWNYGYYSPWYAWHAPYYHYNHYYAWRPYYGHGHHYYGYGNRHNKGKGHNKNYRNDSDYRYAGDHNGGNGRGNRRGEYADDVKRPAGRDRHRSYSGSGKPAPAKRYVSTAPSGNSGNRGMEIRSRGSKDTGRARTHPIGNDSVTGIKLEPSGKRATQTSYRSKRSTSTAGEVRYRSGAKQGRSRVQPVAPTPNSNRYAIATTQARPVTASGNGGRYAQSAPVKNSGSASNRATTGHEASRSASSSQSSARSHRSSGNSGRSQSKASSSSSRQSRQSGSSSHKKRE